MTDSAPEPATKRHPRARTADPAVAETGAEARLPSGSAWRGRWAIAAGVLGLWPGALCLACAGGRDGHHAPMAAEHDLPPDTGTPATRPRVGAGPAAHGDGTVLTEAAARALLAERFRAAGFRVRYDVQVSRDGAFALTVDGYDPARRVGFEYVAEGETDADLGPDERTALARDHEQRILIVDAHGPAGVEADRIGALADRFLQALEKPGPRAPR